MNGARARGEGAREGLDLARARGRSRPLTAAGAFSARHARAAPASPPSPPARKASSASPSRARTCTRPSASAPSEPGRTRIVSSATARRVVRVRLEEEHPRAAAPRLLHPLHEVEVGRDRVDAPQHHEVRVHGVVGARAGRLPHHRPPARVLRRRADGPLEPGGAEPVEEGHPGVPLHEPHRARVRVRAGSPRRRRSRGSPSSARATSAMASSQRARRKRPSPFGPVRTSGCSSRSGRVHRPVVPVHLGAERAAAVRVLGVAAHADRAAVLDLDEEPAGVGAVVGADGAGDHHAAQDNRRGVPAPRAPPRRVAETRGARPGSRPVPRASGAAGRSDAARRAAAAPAPGNGRARAGLGAPRAESVRSGPRRPGTISRAL